MLCTKEVHEGKKLGWGDGSMVKVTATSTKTRVQIPRTHVKPGGHGGLLVISVWEGGGKGSQSKLTS